MVLSVFVNVQKKKWDHNSEIPRINNFTDRVGLGSSGAGREEVGSVKGPVSVWRDKNVLEKGQAVHCTATRMDTGY